MKCKTIRTFLCIAAPVVIFVAGCNRPARFSTVLEGGFDPVGEFRKHGYTVETETRGEGIRNAKSGYAWQSWCGVLAQTNGATTCDAVAVVIRDELNRSLNGGSLDELTQRSGRSVGQPLTGMLRYNKDAVHGDMHVWLTPISSNAAVSYVIFVREDSR